MLVWTLPAALHGFTAWSEVAPRVFLALFLSSLTAKTTTEIRLVRWIGTWGGVCPSGSFRSRRLPVVHLGAPPARLPPARDSSPPGRPHRLLVVDPGGSDSHAQRHLEDDGFEYWFVLSLMASASGVMFYQLCSRESYDAHFFGFHLFKILSFVLMLAGFFSDVSAVYRREAEAAVQLRCANEALAEEIEERQQVEEELWRSRDELRRASGNEPQTWRSRAGNSKPRTRKPSRSSPPFRRF